MSVNGLQQMTDRIIADARAEADRILAAAEQDCKALAEQYAQEASDIRDQLATQAEQKGADLIARAKASAAMQKRNILLQQKSDLLDGVFSGAKEWVIALEGQQYAELLAGLLAAAFVELSAFEDKMQREDEEQQTDTTLPFEILLNKKDRDRCGKELPELVRKRLNGKAAKEQLDRLQLSAQTVEIDGGALLRCGSIESNCSFSLLFADLRRELESDANRALFAQRGQIL